MAIILPGIGHSRQWAFNFPLFLCQLLHLSLRLSVRPSLCPSVPLSVCAPSSLNFSHCPVLAVAKTFVPHFIQDISAPHVQFLLVSYFARFRPGSAFPLPPHHSLSLSTSFFLFISATTGLCPLRLSLPGFVSWCCARRVQIQFAFICLAFGFFLL